MFVAGNWSSPSRLSFSKAVLLMRPCRRKCRSPWKELEYAKTLDQAKAALMRLSEAWDRYAKQVSQVPCRYPFVFFLKEEVELELLLAELS